MQLNDYGQLWSHYYVVAVQKWITKNKKKDFLVKTQFNSLLLHFLGGKKRVFVIIFKDFNGEPNPGRMSRILSFRNPLGLVPY